LQRIDRSWTRRRALWRQYLRGLKHLPLSLAPEPPPGAKHAYHLFTVLVDPERLPLCRDEFTQRMAAAGIGVGVHYRSIPDEPFYRDRFGWRSEDYPHAQRIGRQTASLPLSSRMTRQDVTDVIAVVERVCSDAVRASRSRPARGRSDD
jgi:dTDP-4-amino-4,6-dideoxygalactose transaminase